MESKYKQSFHFQLKKWIFQILSLALRYESIAAHKKKLYQFLILNAIQKHFHANFKSTACETLLAI